MNDDNQPNPGPQPWHDPALEARIVAWVMGEASAFEVAELERLVAETPELALFKRRLEAVHGLAAEAARPPRPKLQLSAERRRKLLDVIGTAPAPAPEKKVRVLPAAAAWWKAPVWSLLAACLIVGVFVAVFSFSVRFGSRLTGPELAEEPDFVRNEAGFVTANLPPSAVSQPVAVNGSFQAQDMKSDAGSNYNYQTSVVVTGQSAGGMTSSIAPTTAPVITMLPAPPQSQPLAAATAPEESKAEVAAIRKFSGGWGKGSGSGSGVEKSQAAVVTGSLEQSNSSVMDGNVAVTAGSMVSTGVVTSAAPVTPLAGPAPAEDRMPVIADVPMEGGLSRQADEGIAQAQLVAKLQTNLESKVNALRTAGGEIAKTSPTTGREEAEGEKFADRSPSTPTAFETRPRSETVALGEVPRASLTADMDGAAAPAEEAAVTAGERSARSAVSANAVDALLFGVAAGQKVDQRVAAKDGQAITALDPVTGEVVKFDGFINYGSPIIVGKDMTENVINQPVFSTRQNTPGESKTVLVDEKAKEDFARAQNEAVIAGTLQGDAQAPTADKAARKDFAMQAQNESDASALADLKAQLEENAALREKLLAEGNAFKDSGRYDLAAKRYEQTLQADPYNIEARRGIEALNQARAKSQQMASNETQGRQLWATATWETPVRHFQAGPSTIIEQPQVDSSGREQIRRKLDDIVIPKIDFQEATVAEALEFLKKRSEALDTTESDPSRKGVNVVLKLDPDSPEAKARITLALTDIPLRAAIDYVSKAASLKTKIEPYAVAVVPMSESTDVLVTKEYKVPADFITQLPVKQDGSPSIVQRASAKEFLEASGVPFPQGASAYYLTSSKKLIIRNTQANLDLVDTLVENMPTPTPTPAPTPKPTSSLEIPAAQQPFSTFSLHVSDVSFLLAKDALARGERPDPARIRTEEFYNAFDYNDPAPGAKEEVACRIEECAHPFLPQRDLVRVALKVAAAGRAAGQPLRLTILLDTSGSMEREDRAASVRRALAALAQQLGPRDRVTLIGFARTPRLLADNVPGDQAAKLVDIADRTPSEGGTNLEAALALASEMALKQKLAGAQNRIVLLTDGAANLGNADPGRLAKQITRTRQQGISFDACGVGANGLDDEMLEALTRKGDGRYYFLNKPEDADAGFARQLAGALRPAAENVKVQVVFNPLRVNAYRLFGFEQHLLKKEDFRNDKVQAAELSAEEAGVALYQVQTLPNGEGDLGQVFVRFRDPASGQMVERSWPMPYEAKNAAFEKAAPSLQLAATAAFLAESLRGDPQVDLDALAPTVNRLRAQYGAQARVGDLVQMIQRLRH